MTNKELILTKIKELRFINKHNDEFEQGFNNALDCISNFLNSLPVEQPSGDLEKVATALTNEIVGELNVGDHTDHSGHNAHWHSFNDGVVTGAQWQKEQDINLEYFDAAGVEISTFIKNFIIAMEDK